MADAVEHEAAVLPACFQLTERWERSPGAAFLPLRPLADRVLLVLPPSPSMNPTGSEGLCLIGGWGRGTDALCSVCPPGHQLLPVSRARMSTAGTSRKMLVLCCAKLCHAKSLRAGPAQQGSEGVLQPR